MDGRLNIISDEMQRLQTLREYGLLDTPDDESLDRITRLAAMIFDAPVSTISLIDQDRQFFKSRFGIEHCIAAREGSFCSHVVEEGLPLIVTDARSDSRFASSPYVTGEPHIRFYLGIPLITPTRFVLGTLCVYDFEPREGISRRLLDTAHTLARVVVDSIELKRIAVRDFLTNLLTRGGFSEAASLEIKRAERSGAPLSLLIIDVDHFKRVNDTYGHAAGDHVLRVVAEVINSASRPYDVSARIGGEEFAILLPDCGLQAAEQLAERLRASIKDTKIFGYGDPISITASLGVSAVNVAMESVIDPAMARADRALYRSKSSGRDRVTSTE